MYLPFFGLSEKPFAITPDPRYLYLSERHAEALAHLLYGITEAGGFIQLTGEVGTGKTTVIRSLLAQIPKNAEIALILNPKMTAPEFLLTICEELGIGVPNGAQDSLKDLVDILSQYLLKAHSSGKRIVLVVDEAQNLAPDVLEQVRLLTNLETNTQKLLQIILIGQPELRELLGRQELRQLAQRITGRYHLDPLSADETTAYVLHRLRVAGATTDIFTPYALSEVYRLSGGVPRVINVICDRALLGAYTQDRHSIAANLVRHSASEVFGKRVSPRWVPWVAVAATALLITLAAVALWQITPIGKGSGAAQANGNAATQGTGGARRTGASPPANQPSDTTGEAGTRGAITRASAAIADALASNGGTSAANEARPTVTAGAQTPNSATPAAAVQAANRTPKLSELLARSANETDPDSAFLKLFGLWNARYVAGNTDPCAQASKQGLECFVQRGSLAQLRIYNRPAILLLNDDLGASHQVVLSGLTDENARILLAAKTHDIGIAELSRYWFGDFIILWKPPVADPKPLTFGMKGEEVRWLRQNLQQLKGVESKQPVSDVYDAELSTLVRNFQREHRLQVDGVAGLQTLVVLNSATATADTPMLQAVTTASHGS
jgi:general secretion pathway protein A